MKENLSKQRGLHYFTPNFMDIASIVPKIKNVEGLKNARAW